MKATLRTCLNCNEQFVVYNPEHQFCSEMCEHGEVRGNEHGLIRFDGPACEDFAPIGYGKMRKKHTAL